MKVLVAIRHSFPFGTPGAMRANALINILKQLKYEVIVLCEDISEEIIINKGGYCVFEGTKIYFLNHTYVGKDKLLKMPFDYAEKMEYIINNENPNLIISSSLYDRFSLIKKSSEKHRLPLIIESCEWYDPSTFKGGRLSHHYILFSYCWKYLFPKADGVIAISRLLEKHYKEKCDNVIRIPTILKTDAIIPVLNLPLENKIRLLFAGALARTKDSVRPFFEAFDLLEEKAKNFEVYICGVETEELNAHLGQDIYTRYKDSIICKGRVPQQTIADEYKNSHFGIFMRPLQRSSNAGFSTKLGEGMSLGTPFIVNDTSDIALYIKNGENGFVVSSDPNKIAEVFTQILNMSNGEYNMLRIKARKTAESDFNCNSYVEEMGQLINRVISSTGD